MDAMDAVGPRPYVLCAMVASDAMGASKAEHLQRCAKSHVLCKHADGAFAALFTNVCVAAGAKRVQARDVYRRSGQLPTASTASQPQWRH